MAHPSEGVRGRRRRRRRSGAWGGGEREVAVTVVVVVVVVVGALDGDVLLEDFEGLGELHAELYLCVFFGEGCDIEMERGRRFWLERRGKKE